MNLARRRGCGLMRTLAKKQFVGGDKAANIGE